MKRSLFFVLLFLGFDICFCQNAITFENNNPRSNKPLGADAGIRYIYSVDRSLMFSTTLSYFITHQIGLEINLAMDQKDGRHFSTGGRFHLNSGKSVKRFTPFIGALIGVEYGEGFIQIPLGLNYLTHAGFETSLSINELFYINSWRTTFLELRFGWRFKLKK
jgi:hypothetical protein